MGLMVCRPCHSERVQYFLLGDAYKDILLGFSPPIDDVLLVCYQ